VRRRTPPLTFTAWLRYDVVSRLLPTGHHRLLEIGAGQGSVSSLLARRFDYVGVEPDPISYRVAARRVGHLGQLLNCSVEELPDEERFDIVCAFDVLEHIEDDRGALAQWLRHLRPGGRLLISVPSGPHRFGVQDEYVGHFRRYDRAGLVEILGQAGLRDLEVISYGFPLGHVLEVGRSTVARFRAVPSTRRDGTNASARWLQPPDWAAPATQGLTFPFRLLQRRFAGTELGTGLVAHGHTRGASS
jgi:SAM-dependent methyltransferase